MQENTQNIIIKNVSLRSLADLKRLPVGTKLRLIHSPMGTENKARVVVKKNATALGFSGDGIAKDRTSWLAFPKAADFLPTDRGFKIFLNGYWPKDSLDESHYIAGADPVSRKVMAEYIFDDSPSDPPVDSPSTNFKGIVR